MSSSEAGVKTRRDYWLESRGEPGVGGVPRSGRPAAPPRRRERRADRTLAGRG